MKFHFPSFLLGVGSTAAVMGAGAALRPLAVELYGLGLHVARLGRAIALRQRERIEDLWAEVEESARQRARGRKRGPPRPEGRTPRDRDRTGEPRTEFSGNAVKAN